MKIKMENEDRIPNELYKKILENVIIADIDIVIHNKGKVLLVYRNEEPAKNQWWVPGGRQKRLEIGKKAVIEKTKQETGLDIKVEKMIGVYEEIFDKTPFHDEEVKTHHLIRAYLVKPINGDQQVKIDKTSLDYKWIDKMDESLHPYVRRVLKDSYVFC